MDQMFMQIFSPAQIHFDLILIQDFQVLAFSYLLYSHIMIDIVN